MCTTTATDRTCTNSGTDGTIFFNTTPVAGQNANANATTTNSGTANTFVSQTNGGGNATATNTGTVANGIAAVTKAGGNATANNSGTNGLATIAETMGLGGDATAINSGTTTGMAATTNVGNATVINSGTNFLGAIAATVFSGDATITNSGKGGVLIASTSGTGNATVTNSGAAGAILASTGGKGAGSGDALVNNSGTSNGIIIATANGVGNSTVVNSGVAKVPLNSIAIDVESANGTATLTNVVGGRVIGQIFVDGNTGVVNFQGGNWLFTIFGAPFNINTRGAPFVVSSATDQIAVLDPTTFALADRSLTNFTGQVSQVLQDRFAGMSVGASGQGALGFAAAPESAVANQAQAVFSGIPTVAMSYASGGARPVIGKAPAAAAAPYYDTTVWVSGFGGERKQRADGVILPTTDTAFGGALGVDRIVGTNLRLGAFVGAGAGRESVDLDVQKIDSTYVFGGAYGRFDWFSQYLDFALYGGGIDNKSTRQIANNTVASGLETATASYGGWFISPELTYGYRIPVNAITVTPRLRLRYVGGQLDGYSESGSMQNLSVGRRAINDFEERGELEFATVSGPLKAAATVGVIGLERLGNPTINTVLLAQSLSFTTPGQASAFGGVFGLRVDYRAMANVALFVAGEGTVMSDKSESFAATGGARVSF